LAFLREISQLYLGSLLPAGGNWGSKHGKKLYHKIWSDMNIASNMVLAPADAVSTAFSGAHVDAAGTSNGGQFEG
jgi:hypothetical protein